MDHSKLVIVDAFGSQVEADLAKSMLESAGINALLQADAAGGMDPPLAWGGFGFKVLVREEDAASARELLQPPPEGELVFVQAFATEDEADTAASMLLSAGIVPTIPDAAVDVPPSLTSTSFRFRVLVPKEDAAKARDILKRIPEPSKEQSG